MGDLGIEVVEIITGRGDDAFSSSELEEGLDEGIEISAAGTDAEGGFFFDDGSFEEGFDGDIAYIDTSMDLFVVTIVGGHVEYTAQTTAKTGWEAAFVEGDVLHSIAVEGTEEASKVVDVVEGYTVEEEEILVGSSTTNIHAGLSFATRLDTGEELDGFDDVGLTKDDRDRFEVLDGNIDGAHLTRPGTIDAVGNNINGLQIGGVVERDIDLFILVEPKGFELWLVAYIGESDLDTVGPKGKRVATVNIGDGALLGE